MSASGDILLDSSVVIPFLKGDAAVRGQFLSSQTLFLPQIVLGELYCGANLSSHPARGVAQIHDFLTAVVLL